MADAQHQFEPEVRAAHECAEAATWTTNELVGRTLETASATISITAARAGATNSLRSATPRRCARSCVPTSPLHRASD
jgi:hypothetical protein